VRGRSVDWQPVPAYGRCAPAGATVLAANAEAVVYTRVIGGGDPHDSWYGCLRAIGREQRLVSVATNDVDTVRLAHLALAGRYVALEISDYLHDEESDVETASVYDLSTGKPAYSIDTNCGLGPCEVDALVLNSSGFAAWHFAQTVWSYPLSGVSCASVALCVSIDGVGNVLTTTDPTGGANAWSAASVDAPNSLTGISCPAASLCVAVDAQGNAVSATDTTAGSAAWTAAAIDAGNPLTAVSCPSTTLCVAVDHSGQILTSTDPTGGAGAWRASMVDPDSALTAVSCPSTTLCVAVDTSGRILTSTDPTDTPAAWTAVQIPSSYAGATPPTLAGLSCPSISLCVATGTDFANGGIPPPGSPPPGERAIVSTNPTGGASSWTSTPIGVPFDGSYGISCASASLCVIGQPLGLITSTNPTGGAGAWSTVLLSGVTITGLSCPSDGLCAAVDDHGRIATSTAPASTWTTANVDVPACAASAVCETEQIFVHDDRGTHAIDSTTTPGDGTALAHLSLSGDQLTWTHNGTPRDATLG
jgi:hypothetical protein